MTAAANEPSGRRLNASRWLWFATCLLISAILPGTTSTKTLSLNSHLSSDPDVVPVLNSRTTQTEHTYFPRVSRTDDVKFDNFSLILRGQRVFLHSGEFHTFRLPVASLWPDILQKIKAAGLNAVSVYTHMGLLNPSRGVVDFNSFRALDPLFNAAKEAGIWVVLRPGPYINAETTAGGIPHWITTEIAGEPRSNDTDYQAAWQDYIKGIIKLTEPHQISSGGPVIAVQVDNEFSQDPAPHAAYFAQLEDVYHDSSIDVPLTYNDPGMRSSFINGTGAVDLYGFDAYPQGYDCTHQTWRAVATNYHSYHAQVNPSQPLYIPEFQSGSFDPWGIASPGYDGCRQLTSPEFLSIFNYQLWASNAKLINYYMFYGGTSWGALPYPGVYTSYDYGATIAESRGLTTKFDEMKMQGMFIRSSPEFYKTDWIADTTTGLAISSDSAAFVTKLGNPDTKAGFYITRQVNSTSGATISFKLNVTTSVGPLQVPQVVTDITIAGRRSKVITTDYTFGSSKVLYSTAQIFYAGAIDGRDILFLYGNSTQSHEAAIKFTGTPTKQTEGSSLITFTTNHTVLPQGLTIVGFSSGIKGLITVWDSDKQLVLFADSDTAATFWSPIIAGPSVDPFRNFWGIGTNQSIIVGGPYLVRNASITGRTLALRGDLQNGVKLTVIAPRNVNTITWNGERVTINGAASSTLTSRGGFVGELRPKATLSTITVPTLAGWVYKDSLPEIQSGFDDSSWAVANHTTTNIPFPQYYGDGKILYGCDYGFCENIVIWRGHFMATGSEKSMNISVNGGTAFAASVWLNNIFLGTSGNTNVQETDVNYTFPAGAILPGKDNVVTVVHDNMGLDENGYSSANVLKSPRGIRGFKLDTGAFAQWKVQGKVGGYKNYPDKTRGVLNEGGLFGERKGWHLPSFPTRDWISRPLSSGLPNGPGVGFFVTTFNLNIKNVDAMMSFTFTEPLGQSYRASLFVNGWMMGKRVAAVGPQAKFPVHEGILNYHGENTVAVALWSMSNSTVSPDLQLVVDAVVEGGVGGVVTDNPVWSARGRE